MSEMYGNAPVEGEGLSHSELLCQLAGWHKWVVHVNKSPAGGYDPIASCCGALGEVVYIDYDQIRVEEIWPDARKP